MHIDVWKGDWGLPTIDIECLKTLTFIKFAGAPVCVNKTSNPFKTPNGALPVFRHCHTVLTSFEEVSGYLQKQNYSPDHNLSPKDCAEILAYSRLMREKLYPALQYIWWVDERNYVDLSRPWYAKALPFPLNYYYPGQYSKRAKHLLDSLYENIEEEPAVSKMYAEAEKCLTTLAHRLGDNSYFFGNNPTSFDAIVFGYLAPLLKAPFPSCSLQNHLKASTSLLKFVVNISKKYFPTEHKDYEEELKKQKSKAEIEFPNERRNQIMAGIFAVIAMLGYAYSMGIIETKRKNHVARS